MTLRLSIQQFADVRKQMLTHAPLPVSQELVSNLNRALRDMNDENKSWADFQARRAAEAAQKAAEAKAQQEEQNARIAQEAKQAAQEAKAQADEQAAEQAQQAANDRIDKLAKEIGCKGLNKDFGIARFLAKSQQDGTLDSGLGYVFNTKVSPQDSAIHGVWRLTQVVDGWEIYCWTGERQLTTKARTKLPMEGPPLKSAIYVFKGNRKFTLAVNGVAKIVQEFEPVNIPEPAAASQ